MNMADRSGSGLMTTDASGLQRRFRLGYLVFPTLALIAIGAAGLRWISISSFTGPSLWVVGIALVMFTLIVGAALRRWEWLVGPWIASFLAAAGFYAFNHDVTDVPTSVTLLVALALFVAIGVALTVAAAIGVWFGRIWHGRQSAVRR